MPPPGPRLRGNEHPTEVHSDEGDHSPAKPATAKHGLNNSTGVSRFSIVIRLKKLIRRKHNGERRRGQRVKCMLSSEVGFADGFPVSA